MISQAQPQESVPNPRPRPPHNPKRVSPTPSTATPSSMRKGSCKARQSTTPPRSPSKRPNRLSPASELSPSRTPHGRGRTASATSSTEGGGPRRCHRATPRAYQPPLQGNRPRHEGNGASSRRLFGQSDDPLPGIPDGPATRGEGRPALPPSQFTAPDTPSPS